MPHVGRSTPNALNVSLEIGNGTKPIMFSVQMKRKSEATYGNQRPIAFEGRLLSAIWV
jgi:hypothetical protein